MGIKRTQHNDGLIEYYGGASGFGIKPDGAAYWWSLEDEADFPVTAELVDLLVEERLKQRGMMAVPLTTWKDESPKQIEVTVRQMMSND